MKRIGSRHVVTGMLTASLVMSGTPYLAFADTSDELKAELSVVQAELDELYAQAEKVSEDLNDTHYRLETTQASIEENEALARQKATELLEAKRTLAGVVIEEYKDGDLSMLSVILGSGSIEELVSNIYYANKVSIQRQETIRAVKTIAEELSETRRTLETEKSQEMTLLNQQEQLQNELESNINDTQAYIDGLSVQIQEALAAEEAARQEEARRQAEAAAAAAAAAAQAQQQNANNQGQANTPVGGGTGGTGGTVGGGTVGGGGGTTGGGSTGGTTGGGTTGGGTGGGGGSTGGGGLSSGAVATIVSAALSQIGVAYVYGTSSPGVSFDCSGLVSYAYACAGIYVPHSSAALRAYCNKPASQAVAGDIMWSPGHVGICIGGGTTVEAFNPSMGVTYGRTSSFIYAGSPA